MAKKPASTDPSAPASTATDPAIAALGYEDAVRELEQLVESIERGDIGLAESLAAYRKGEQLLRHCKGLLDKAELTVRELSLADAEQAAG
jgi:exodeoxyribonuclease VII small subunit